MGQISVWYLILFCGAERMEITCCRDEADSVAFGNDGVFNLVLTFNIRSEGKEKIGKCFRVEF